jgi:hypothetical protein
MKFFERFRGGGAGRSDPPASGPEKAVEDAIDKGHRDHAALRELLIATTSTVTAPKAMEYFRQHLNDADLLASLFNIAAEGEDMGDAPWAAANVIEEFPPELLSRHRNELVELAAHPWMYLHGPAQRALGKLSTERQR